MRYHAIHNSQRRVMPLPSLIPSHSPAMASVAFSATTTITNPFSSPAAAVTKHLPSAHLRPPYLRLTPLPSATSISISIPVSRGRLTPLLLLCGSDRMARVRAVVEEETAVEVEEGVAEEEEGAGEGEGEEEERDEGKEGKFKLHVRPCELYVCNMPRSCDISGLLELFRPFGTVQSVEVSRNMKSGESRGCGYVTMSSLGEAKAAISALDGSDLGGRELRVKFSAEMVSGRTNVAALNVAPKKDVVFESQHKIYVGNLSWSVKPEELREYFSQFGNVVSTRLLQDRKAGKNRVYAFLSFSSDAELKAALSVNGTEFRGRALVLREVVKME